MTISRATRTVALLALLFLMTASLAAADDDLFPMPQVIVSNVAFWTKVYAQYTTGHGIVHDGHDLTIIYDIIALLPYDAPDANRVNRKRIKRAKNKYRHILRKLAKHPGTRDKAARRVAEYFGDNANANTFLSAAGNVRCQIGQKDRFRAGLIRSGAYIEQIRTIFKRKGLPEALAYLPHVESSFNPNAYSKFGAAGVWQFTRSTGRRFMHVGYELDERRDPILATHAAAALLAENYAKLGSWPLAITAYNHGAAGMQRARNKHGDYARIFQDYRSRTFKFASRNFYSEFLAARHVASNYKTYFGELSFDRPTGSHVVSLVGYAPIADLQTHFKVDMQTLRSLNPALRKPVFEGQKHIPKGYALRLPPAENMTADTRYAKIPDDLYRPAQKRSRFYTVQRGDTAGKIARMHNVRLRDLVLANNLDRRAVI
ncbi:MAG: transglycosylase SLT domain-containing protein, partial [Desulfatitalea sp.]|nr:transglycosylase SLT domain-containing protein [Desulfatitalea sp.]NNK02290.1 transglycosylase SLT domain-containing protein [Desulfatitalea sp.]